MKVSTKFPSAQGMNFYGELRKRVNKDFSDKGISVHANGKMWLKASIFLSLFIALYFTILLVNLNGFVLAGLTIMLGVVCAFIGFNVCHDAIHGAFSANKKTNKRLSLIFHLVGANPYCLEYYP